MIFAHHKPHFRRIPAAPGTPHALEKTGDGKRCVNLESALQPADINAEFQRGCRADRHQGIVVLHLLLGILPVGSGEIAVVDEKTVGFMIGFTVLPQTLADGLAFFA